MLSSADPPSTIGALLTSELVTNLAPLQNVDLLYTKIQVRRLSIPQIGGDYITGYPIEGSSGQTTLDIRSSVVVSLTTPVLGKSYRGRLYLPCTHFFGGTPGLVDGTIQGDIQTIFDDFVAAVGVGGANTDMAWGVWSAKLGNTYEDADNETGQKLTGYVWAAGFQPINGTVVQPIVYTQRRRGFNVRIRD
jgi:hypothetical protein